MSNVNPELYTDDSVSFRITQAHKNSPALYIQYTHIHTNITFAAAVTVLLVMPNTFLVFLVVNMWLQMNN